MYVQAFAWTLMSYVTWKYLLLITKSIRGLLRLSLDDLSLPVKSSASSQYQVVRRSAGIALCVSNYSQAEYTWNCRGKRVMDFIACLILCLLKRLLIP